MEGSKLIVNALGALMFGALVYGGMWLLFADVLGVGLGQPGSAYASREAHGRALPYALAATVLVFAMETYRSRRSSASSNRAAAIVPRATTDFERLCAAVYGGIVGTITLEQLEEQVSALGDGFGFSEERRRTALIRGWEHAAAAALQYSQRPDPRALDRLAAFQSHFQLADDELNKNGWLSRLQAASR